MSFFYWILVASVGCLVGKWVYQYPQKYGRIIGCAFALLVVLSPLYYEFPNTWISKVATYEDGKIIYHPYGTFCPEFSKGKCFNVRKYGVAVSSGVNPLTSNPKVRSVQYSIVVKIVSPEIFYSDLQRRQLSTVDLDMSNAPALDTNINRWRSDQLMDEIYRATSYWLFEFNESFSQQIGEFYNPNDEEQKRRFGILIEGYVNPKIVSEGLVIEFQSFTINYI